MKILVVNWLDRENPQAGGAEQHLHEIFGRLTARGHDVDLVCSGWAGAAPAAVLDGMRVHRVAGRYTFAVRGRGAVRRLLGRGSYDVVVEDINKLPLFLSSLTDLPLYVIVPHLFGTTAFLEAPLPVAAAVWMAERPLPRSYRHARFHAISESTRDDLAARGVAADRIRVIYPGIDTDAYTPDAATPRTPHPSFLYVGRLRRYKGMEYAIRALARARRERSDVTLDVAGTGPDRPRLERLTERLGLADAVTFHGFVSDDMKRKMLRQTWANLYPSAKEGWGITNLEAAACGTPSIASDASALRESVRHGETGWLVPHGDVDAWARTMLDVARAPEAVQKMAGPARRFAESFSWDRTADDTEEDLRRCRTRGSR